MESDTPPELIAYQDAGTIVFCELDNPNAWIRTDTVVSIEEVERDRLSPL